MNFKALALLFLSSLEVQVAMADGSFAASCKDWKVRPTTSFNPNHPPGYVDLTATCRERVGIYHGDTVINLNTCFANADGRLQGQAYGGFSGSCWDFGRSGSALLAKCRNNAGNTVDASIDMNDFIGNHDGHMKCFGANRHN